MTPPYIYASLYRILLTLDVDLLGVNIIVVPKIHLVPGHSFVSYSINILVHLPMLLLFEGASRVIEKFPAGQTIDDIKIQKIIPLP